MLHSEFKVMTYVKQVMQVMKLEECERIINYLSVYVSQRARSELDVVMEDDNDDD